MSETLDRGGKRKVPAAIDWLPGPRDLTYTDLELTDITISRTMVIAGGPD